MKEAQSDRLIFNSIRENAKLQNKTTLQLETLAISLITMHITIYIYISIHTYI